MDQTDKRNALIARVTERIFVSNAAMWPKSQMKDLVEKAFVAASEYAEFMFDQKDAFKFNATETPELIGMLDDIDTRLIGLDEKMGVYMDRLNVVVGALAAKIDPPARPE